MRYIGNKTRLLGFIRRTLRARGIAGGRALDPFSGTASVARALKRWGFAVTAGDIMQYGYILARARVAIGEVPDFQPLSALLGIRRPSLTTVLHQLSRLPPRPGFIHEHYSPAGGAGASAGRMYFTPENAARIDTIRASLHEWRAQKVLDDDAHDLLLASLIEAADRVANTTGVYAAFVKSWQPNALRPLTLGSPGWVPGNGCSARREDALDLVRTAPPCELLYLDPPYNNRQYAGYYHVPEVIALGWFDAPLELRGKTGLIADRDKRSDWSSSRRCEQALEELLAAAHCRRVVLSYNAEGLIPESTIEKLLRDYGLRATYRRYRRGYRRYRSDADSDTRRYRGDVVNEYLYCVDRG